MEGVPLFLDMLRSDVSTPDLEARLQLLRSRRQRTTKPDPLLDGPVPCGRIVDSVRVVEDDFAADVMAVAAVVVETSSEMARELEHRPSCRLVVHRWRHLYMLMGRMRARLR